LIGLLARVVANDARDPQGMAAALGKNLVLIVSPLRWWEKLRM
jgi:hypothetical protein